MNLRHWVLAAAMAAGVSVTATQAAPLFQDQSPDYSRNKTYQQGVRDGKNDHTANKDHSKKRHYKKDDDQKAYEAGYQKGRN
jgi:uncharacterized membrane protein